MKIVSILFTALLLSAKLITPIPDVQYDRAKARLGKILFFDPQFSKDGKISCASCHSPKDGWADSRPVSIGVYGRKGVIQSPTVLNSYFNFRQFWNGRAKDLYDQIDGPVHAKNEMGVNEKFVEKKLNSSKFYKKEFLKVYNARYITYPMFKDAIAEFEKSLVTPDSKFDLYLKGREKLNSEERRGFFLFKKYGCITCHNGVNVGGNSFQKMGLVKNFGQCVNDRYAITHDPLDRCVYKVPSLRNIAKTAPYFHNAKAKTLEEAVRIMAKYNLGLEMDKKDVKSIVAFLKTLSSDVKEGR